MKSIFLIAKLSFLLLPIFVIAQNRPQVYNTVPPSPNASAFTRYREYPVSNATGLIQIEVPLYTIQLKTFSFPINLSYHASGRRAKLDYSPVGLGWIINASGNASRTIKGRTDPIPNSFSIPKFNDLNPQSDYSKIEKLLDMEGDNGALNNQHDIFSFAVGDKSGKFIVTDLGVVFLNGEPYKGTIHNGGIIITDENGTAYTFADREDNTVYTAEKSTSWFLSKITTSEGEEIIFQYTIIPVSNTNDIVGNWIVRDEVQISDQYQALGQTMQGSSCLPPQTGLGVRVDQVYGTPSVSNYKMRSLSSIDFPNGRIAFVYDSKMKLTSMDLFNRSGALLRKNGFSYQSVPNENLSNNNSQLLNSTWFQDPAGNQSEVYHFSYYDDPAYRLNNLAQNIFLKNKDWWGFLNNKSNNFSVPKFEVDNYFSSPNYMSSSYGTPGVKNPSFGFKLNTTLKKIIYPTKGYSEFIYEPNRGKRDGNPVIDGPGLRIGQINTGDGSGNELYTQYKYGDDENGIGYFMIYPSERDFKSARYRIIDPGSGDPNLCFYRETTYTSEPIESMAEAYSFPIYYNKVTEYKFSSSEPSIKKGKTEFYYSVPQIDANYLSMPGGSFTTLKGNMLCNLSSFLYREVYLGANNNSKLIGKSVYERGTSGNFNMIYSEQSNYAFFKQQTIFEIFMSRWIDCASSLYYTGAPDQQCTINRAINEYAPMFGFASSSVNVAGNRLVRHEVAEKINNQLITRVDLYEYGSGGDETPSDQFPRKKKTTFADGIINEVEYKYASEKNNQKLINANIIGIPLETAIVKKENATATGKTISRSETKYDNPAHLFPSSAVSYNILDNTPSTEVTYDKYDSKGNLQQYTIRNGVPTAIVWGYNNTQPIAKVEGATYAQVENLVSSIVSASDSDASNPANEPAFIIALDNFRRNADLSAYQITTYTYDPLIGVTSITPPSGIREVYIYDTANRLKEVREDSKTGKLVKEFKYNYKN
ncbi:hypothetical protein C1631_006500 [Chryseobacterium phosphatilyticum]|uniref:Sugar-binding protein n=1 Tax=Chryseobacterium phosphatilyticum TaxID=475075 RepID=A0A316XEG2_9FLAO|nr:hypothetical protein [Chryseobacterium phosphatilyticum]PWN72245.1 hypothetical protein C1631_006500 [Chryseobacterium phosphatilyticum]